MQASVPDGVLVGNRWRITGTLGEGGFGQVYRAVDESEVKLGYAAVKVLHPNTSPQERDEFLREVQKIAALRHQNLVGYLDSGHLHLNDQYGRGEIRPYLVTELCAGSLVDRLAAEPPGTLATAALVPILADITAGLAHLHERHLIHRDLKPANVLYADGNWKLADFGLMRDLSRSGAYHRGELLMGTPLFMAPELFTTVTTTAASDLYALGVLAHLCATGHPLHRGSGGALMHNIASTAPSIDPSLDPVLLSLITRATAPDPAQRPTARQLHDDLTGSGPGQARSHTRTQIAPAHPRAPLPAPPVLGGGPSYHHQQGGQTPLADWVAGGHRPAASSRSLRPTRWLLASAAAVLAIAGLAGAVVTGGLLDRGGDSSAPGFEATGDDVSGAAGGASPSESNGGTGDGSTRPDDGTNENGSVQVGGGVVLDGVTIEETGDAEPAVGGPVADPTSHLDVEPCATGEKLPAGDPAVALAQMQVTNRATQPVDYLMGVNFFTSDGAQVDELYDLAYAVAPGQSALLHVASHEEGATSCELVELTLTPVEVAAYEGRELVEIQSCQQDDFFDSDWNTSFRATNPLDVRADLEVWFAVVDSTGIRLDDSFSESFSRVAPNGAVQESDAGLTFFDVRESGRAVAECVVTKMAAEPSL